MKGHIKIIVEEIDECGNFPIKKTFTVEEDNTWESVEDWVNAFRSILFMQGFCPDTVNEYVPDPTDEPIDSNRN